jgi:hypothetical protein
VTSLAQELQDTWALINPTIQRAERAIERLYTVQGRIELPDTKDHLGFRQQAEGWRLVIISPSGQVHLLLSASRRIRLLALKALPRLVKELEDITRWTPEEAERVLTETEQYLNTMER